MKSDCLVSVIIPTHNRKDLLKISINSVLNQTYQNIEIIVVDDFSTDGTKDFILSLRENRIRYFKNETNLYAAESRNIGIKYSKGEFIAFLDDDDEWLPEKLEKQIPLFNNDQVGIVYSSINLFFETYNFSYKTVPTKKGYIYKSLLIKNYIGATPSVMVRKQAIKDIKDHKFFNSIFPAREEYDLWIRISKNWEIDYVKEPLVKQYYRNDIKRISTNINNYVNAINLLNLEYDTEVKQMLTEKEQRMRLFFQQFFMGSQAIKIGNSKLARKYYLSAFKIDRKLKAIISYVLSFFGARIVIISRYYFDRIFGR